jgi:hypothetical protein
MAYDWALIKREYIQGYTDDNGVIICPTLDCLCERHGCSLSTIMKKSASEKWQQERKLFGRKKEERIEEKKLSIMAEESADVDNKALNVAVKGIGLVDERLCGKELSHHDLMKLSTTAATFHKMAKLALGEPTEHTTVDGKQDLKVDIYDRIKNYEQRFTTIKSSKGSDSGDGV